MEGKKKLRKGILFFHLFGYPWKIQGKKKNSFSFVWLTTKKSQGKMEGKQNQQFVLDGYQFVE